MHLSRLEEDKNTTTVSNITSTIMKERRIEAIHSALPTFDDNEKLMIETENINNSKKKETYCWMSLFLRRCLTFFVLFLFLAIGLIFMLVPDACPHYDQSIRPLLDPTDLGILSDVDKQQKHFVVQLHGDSLMKNPEDMHYHLHDEIYALLPSYKFTLERYADYAKSMEQVAIMINSTSMFSHDAIIVLGDVDITNVYFDSMNATNQKTRRERYTSVLKNIVQSVVHRGKHIALCSPGSVLTEAQQWFMPVYPEHALSARFTPTALSKQIEYRAIVQSVSAIYNVPFIDLREPFLAAVPSWRLVYKGCVTRDGEHSNAYGTILMARLFAKVLQRWFYEDLIALTKPPTPANG